MTRSTLSPDMLLKLAKKSLRLSASESSYDAIPEGYVDELRKHVKFSKDDTLFHIIPEPGHGYGKVLCLEKGCENVTIHLTQRTSTGDNGLKSGIGSLSAYRVHVQEHATHKANRFARVKEAANATSLPVINSETHASFKGGRKHVASSLLTALDSHVDSTCSTDTQYRSPNFYPSSSSTSSSSMGKTLKRSFTGDDTDITIPSSSPHSSPLSSKKRKEEQFRANSTSHLAPRDRNMVKSVGATSVDSVPLRFPASESIPSLFEKENTIMNNIQTLLKYYRKAPRKMPRDKKRIVELEMQLGELRATRARRRNLNASTSNSVEENHGSIVVQQPQNMGVEPYNSDPANIQRVVMDVKPHASISAASALNTLPVPMDAKSTALIPAYAGPNPPFMPMVVKPPGSMLAYSNLSAQFGGIQLDRPDSTKQLLGAIPPFNLGFTSTVAGELINYGDTMDCESGDLDTNGYGNYPHSRGPVADPSDIDKFLIEAGNSELFDGNESVDKALGKLRLKKLGELLPYMNIALMPHQVIGVAWMLEHERGSHKGGILADDMGLGKTVQMISTMVQHRSNDPAVKSTLICAPLALLDQWKLEIETKTEGIFRCLIYHGANKPKHEKDLRRFDVVLTTFQTLALEWPDDRAAKKKKKKKQKNGDDFIESDSETEKEAKKKKGLLLRTKWFRFVLDEAQNIRNRNTRISNAVTYIEATYRWCLTGTPITNSLADCYAFMRFLKIRPWYDWKDFSSHIAKLEKRSPDLASSRLQAIFNACLIRRKKDSVLDGKKLIELPPKDIILQTLTFSKDERDIYDAIEKKSQAIFNKYLRAGTVLKNYSHILVLLLRLRQLCSHPCLIQEGGDPFIRPEDNVTDKHKFEAELDRITTLAGKQFVSAMKAKFKAIAIERIAAEKASVEAVIEAEDCPICFDTLTDPILTRCCHVFCAECVETVLNQPPVENAGYTVSQRPCPTCRAPIQKEMIFQRMLFEPEDADLEGSQPNPIGVDEDNNNEQLPMTVELLMETKKRKGKGKANKRFIRQIVETDEDPDGSDDSMSDFMQSENEEEEKDVRRELKRTLARNRCIVLDSDEARTTEGDEVELLPPTIVRKKKGKSVQRFLPSTKMKEMMGLLKTWAEGGESKGDKTMVLSQWTSCLDLIADYLDENGFTFVRYQGDMTRLARDEAVRLFMSQGKARVMLMSLKCGGVGLNLTRANRVISLDLGWSSAVENQAFDRVHRLGQTRPVTVQRLVIGDTVEARILALQQRKQNLADGSLGEGTGKKLGRMSVKDLANLFGLNGRGQLLEK